MQIKRMGLATGVDLFRIQDVAEDRVVRIMDQPIRVDRDALTLGYAGVCSSFLLFAKRAGEKHGVPPREMDWDDVYAIQNEIRGRKLARGQRIIGLKAGLTSHAKMKQMGVSTPVFGFLADRALPPPSPRRWRLRPAMRSCSGCRAWAASGCASSERHRGIRAKHLACHT